MTQIPYGTGADWEWNWRVFLGQCEAGYGLGQAQALQ